MVERIAFRFLQDGLLRVSPTILEADFLPALAAIIRVQPLQAWDPSPPVQVSCFTGTQQGMNGSKFRFFPIRAWDYFIFSCSGTGNMHLNIYDVTGKRLYSFPVYSANTFIDIREAREGVYFLQFIHAKGATVKKLAVQKEQ